MKIKVCVGTICHLMGSAAVIEEINNFPEELMNKIELSYATCFDVCHGMMKPPVIRINDKFFENVEPENVKEIIENYMKEVPGAD